MTANDIDRMKRAACSSIPCRVLSLVAQGCVCDPICRLRICYQFWCLSRRRSVRVVLRRVIPGTSLGMRTTGNANPAGGHYQELTALKLGSIFLKQSIEVFDFGLQSRSWKPKENDAGMGQFLLKDQFAEIPVS